MRKYIIALAVVLSFMACNRHSEHWEALCQVETFIEEQPDSALVVLQGIDAGDLSSAEERAKHALMLSMALDKNFIDETDLSLISTAKEYYQDSKDVRYKFLSHYYYGRVLCNNKDYTRAIIEYTQAEQLLAQLNDNYLAGLLYIQIGDIYLSFYDYNKALSAYQLAYQYYSDANLEHHKSYALYGIGVLYMNTLELDRAFECFAEAKALAIKLGNRELELGCYENIVILLESKKDYDECGNTIDIMAQQFDKEQYSLGCLGAIANYYTRIKDYKKGYEYLNYAWKNATNRTDSISLFYKQAQIATLNEDSDEGLRCLSEGVQLQNSELRKAIQQPILSAQKDYYRTQAEFNSYRLKTSIQIYITSAIVVLLLLLIIALYIRQRIVAKDMEISKYMDLAEELQKSIRDKDVELSELSIKAEVNSSHYGDISSRVAELFHKQYELLDKLSNTYYETHGFNIEKERIYELVKSEINKFASDKKTLTQLETIINTYKQNVMGLIRAEIPNITERDIKLLCYIYAGFSAKSISVFIGETTNNILTRKSRLRAKFSTLNTPNMGIILQEMP